MELSVVLVFLAVVFVGSYIQAVAGFAMAMLMVAVIGGLRLLDVPTLAAVISLTTIVNVIVGLWGNLSDIHKRLFGYLALGQLPAIFVGFELMEWLDGNTRWALELILGIFITLGGLSMFLKPHPWPQVSGPLKAWSVGSLGGLVGGMFAASGPILGWFSYNQPLPLRVIRATLLAGFFMTTTTRTVIVGVQGGLTESVWTYTALALPVVLLGTWLGRAFAPPVSDEVIKRFAYMLLMSMGVWILVSTAVINL